MLAPPPWILERRRKKCGRARLFINAEFDVQPFALVDTKQIESTPV